MKDHEAMKQALANIKKLARQSVVDRYKAKKSKPAEAPKKSEPGADLEDDEADELPEVEDEPAEEKADEEKTELIFMGRKPQPKPAEVEAPKKKRGRPPKQK